MEPELPGVIVSIFGFFTVMFIGSLIVIKIAGHLAKKLEQEQQERDKEEKTIDHL